MATQLGIYNDALRILGERRLSSLTEDRPARHKLDTLWNDSQLVQNVLETDDWNWFQLSMRSDYDTGLEPTWGYTRVHNLPSDLLKISGIWLNEYMDRPLEQYRYEGDKIYTDHRTYYLAYIPDNFLDSIAAWPAWFARHIAGELAWELAPDLKNREGQELLFVEARKRKQTARSKDRMYQPSKRQVIGHWRRTMTSNGRTTNRGGRP